MIQIAIVTVSDSAVAGTREDRSGPKLRERAEALGWTIAAQELVPDETSQISAVLRRLADSERFSVILTTGGTGVALRDVTPEATRAVIEREIPGVAEVMRAEGSQIHTPGSAIPCGRRCSRPYSHHQSAWIAKGSRRIAGHYFETCAPHG